MSQRKPSYKQFADAARIVHETNFVRRGDRYATEAEMQMHRADPLACYDMVRDVLERLPRFQGWRPLSGGHVTRA